MSLLRGVRNLKRQLPLTFSNDLSLLHLPIFSIANIWSLQLPLWCQIILNLGISVHNFNWTFAFCPFLIITEAKLRASGLQHLTSTPICGVEGEALFLVSISSIFSLKNWTTVGVGFTGGGWPIWVPIPLFLWKLIGTGVHKMSHYPHFSKCSAFSCFYELKVLLLW